MNLEKLFKMQKELDERILDRFPELRNEDLLDKKILALQVEIGELAQNWRGFKFWSEDREPRTFNRKHCPDCMEKGYRRGNPPYDEKLGTHGLGNHWYFCEKCAGFLVVDENPLLEEYVDCLHFILSIGLEHKEFLDPEEYQGYIKENDNIVEQFHQVFKSVADYEWYRDETDYYEMTCQVLGLGEMLGFTTEQIEQAYFAKNKENHRRQENGY